MHTRRNFLGSMMLPAAVAATAPLAVSRRAHAALLRPFLDIPAADYPTILRDLAQPHTSLSDAAMDEDYWAAVARCYTQDRTCINLNNGGVSPAPAIAQEAMKKHLDYANTMPPPVALWKTQEPRKEHVREMLARNWGVSPEEIAITRNSSESLQICQLGIDLPAGGEILCMTQDYPRMVTTFRQRCRREGFVLKQVKIPIPCDDPKQILDIYREAIGPKTKLILISHIVNITGQIMPVREIVELARARAGRPEIPVIVDGAHALAHFDFKLSDLGCDYYGVSLHKWLCAPHGTGLLYVRKDKIKSLWPMMAADEKLDSDIRKFEEIGTHPAANFLAIAEALTFHQAIGGPRKEARLRYLRDRWAVPLSKLDRVRIHTPMKPQSDGRPLSCAIATVQIEGVDSVKLNDHLWEKHGILTTAIKHDEFEGIRVTPNVYTFPDEIDRFREVLERVVREGLPA